MRLSKVGKCAFNCDQVRLLPNEVTIRVSKVWKCVL